MNRLSERCSKRYLFGGQTFSLNAMLPQLSTFPTPSSQDTCLRLLLLHLLVTSSMEWFFGLFRMCQVPKTGVEPARTLLSLGF